MPHWRRISSIQAGIAILPWDEATYMPKGGKEMRTRTSTSRAEIVKTLKQDPKQFKWLEEAEQFLVHDRREEDIVPSKNQMLFPQGGSVATAIQRS